MKTLTRTLLFIALSTASLLAEPLQVKFEFQLRGIDKKWITDVPLPISEDGISALPSMTLRQDQNAKMELIKEFRVGEEKEGTPVVACGIIIDLTPNVEGKTVTVVGTSVIRRVTHKNANGAPVRFSSMENLIDLNFGSGKTQIVELEDGGELIVTAILTDATGTPYKK